MNHGHLPKPNIAHLAFGAFAAVGSSAVFAGSITITVWGLFLGARELVMDDPRTLAGIIAFGSLSFVGIIVSLRAFFRNWMRRDAPSRAAGLLATSVPLLLLAGAGIGVFVMNEIASKAVAQRAERRVAECMLIFREENAQYERCLDVVDACESRVRSTPCHRPESQAQADNCTALLEKERARATAEGVGLDGLEASSHRQQLFSICVLRRTSN